MDARGDCLFCGKPAEQDHHCTGKGSNNQYLDKDLTAALCGEDHDLVHTDLRVAGIDRPLQAAGATARTDRRLRRLGLFMSRLAEVFPEWADEIGESATTEDEHETGRDD